MKKLIILLLLPMAGFGFMIISSCRPAPQIYNVAIILKGNYMVPAHTCADRYEEVPMHPLLIPTFIKF